MLTPEVERSAATGADKTPTLRGDAGVSLLFGDDGDRWPYIFALRRLVHGKDGMERGWRRRFGFAEIRVAYVPRFREAPSRRRAEASERDARVLSAATRVTVALVALPQTPCLTVSLSLLCV
ncbi:hypothetical protein G5I_10097 [Acromyrmex echinatior]|uniref:Uncharacterized protein n=1 Tax=Acromyrmex echinatior TaxID=103372 RepID=F4WW63_ACREC|nr:hypothetical protein G5I_10097 [Acromyrmex echinatior]